MKPSHLPFRALRGRVVFAAAIILAAAGIGVGVFGNAHAVTLPGVNLGHLPDFDHVVVVVMENREYDSIIGNSKAPYINSLASSYGLAKSFFGTTHSSLPNYLALISGTTNGVTSNCTTCHFATTNIVDQLENAGISWKAYIEGFPGGCSSVATSGTYAKKHNPFMYYDDIVKNPSRCAKVVPFTQLATDLANGTLPRYIWITPDMCDSMHDCGASVGDAWAARTFPSLLNALGSDGVLFLTWDEGTTNAGCCTYANGGHIVTIVAGPGARHASSSTAYDHYSILRTIEDAWGLSRLGNAGCSCSKPMKDLVKLVLL